MNSETAKSNARPAKKYVWTAIEHPGVGMLSIRFETIYGNRCMYVARDGVQIGYYNIGTGTNGGKTSIDREDIERAAEIALRAELTRPTAIVPGVGLVADMVRARSEDADRSALVAPGTRIPSSSESDSDLALNQPGAGVQSRADALRRAAPWKSRIARVLGIKTEERSWRIGAVGERRIAATLCTLGTEWHVIHGIPAGDRDGDIDHLVIGPGGVFSVNSKNHPNAKVWVGGNTVPVVFWQFVISVNCGEQELRECVILRHPSGRPRVDGIRAGDESEGPAGGQHYVRVLHEMVAAGRY